MRQGELKYSRSIDDAQTIFPATHLFNTLSLCNVIFVVVVVFFLLTHTRLYWVQLAWRAMIEQKMCIERSFFYVLLCTLCAQREWKQQLTLVHNISLDCLNMWLLAIVTELWRHIKYFHSFSVLFKTCPPHCFSFFHLSAFLVFLLDSENQLPHMQRYTVPFQYDCYWTTADIYK